MTSSPDRARHPQTRRVPQQSRSRGRVQRVLEVAGELVVNVGVEAMSTRTIAAAADIPVASLYQYFADRDEILLALVERDAAEMDAQVDADLGALEVLTVQTMVDTVMRAFLKVYHRRPSFVVLWMRSRTNPAISAFCRAHNQQTAQRLFQAARAAGMVHPDSNGLYAELAVEVADRVFQLAFEDSLVADPHVVDEGIALVSAYLETHATAAGIAGVRRPEPSG